MNALLAKLRLFCAEAKGKVTTYVGLAIAAISAIGAHAEELVAQWPSISGYLPQAHVLDLTSHYVLSALGLIAMVMRVRRVVWPPKVPT